MLAALGSKFAKLTKDTNQEIRFASGGRVLALPSTGGRGYTGNLILDEFAYHAHAEETWDSAIPTMRLGQFRLRIVSTPNGMGNTFADVVERIRSGRLKKTVLHQVSIEDAAKDGFPVNWDECWEDAKGDPRLFDQLFRCSFLDNQFQYVPTDAIELCESNDDLTKAPGDAHYGGLDIGRVKDRTVLIVIRFCRGVRTVVHIESARRTDSEAIHSMVDRAFQRFNLKRLCIDQTGLGAFPAADIKKKHSERVDPPHRRPRVEPLDFTMKLKGLLATGLYTAITGGTLVLPKTDAALPNIEPGLAKMLRADIAAIRRIVTAAGNVVYDAPSTAEGHADSAWALALALHASSGRNAMFDAVMNK